MSAPLHRYAVVYGLLHGSRHKVTKTDVEPRWYVIDRTNGKTLKAFAEKGPAVQRATFRNGKQSEGIQPLPVSESVPGLQPTRLTPVVGDVVSFVGEDWTVTRGPYPLACGLPGYDLERTSGTKVRGISATSIKRKD